MKCPVNSCVTLIVKCNSLTPTPAFLPPYPTPMPKLSITIFVLHFQNAGEDIEN